MFKMSVVAPNATYSLVSSVASVNEGSNVNVTLTTTGVQRGQSVPFVISGSGVSLEDFEGLTSLTGPFVVGADGTSTINLSVKADQTTEGPETFTVSLLGGQASVNVLLNDTSLSQELFDAYYNREGTVLLLTSEDISTVTQQGVFSDLSGNVSSFGTTGVSYNQNIDLYNDRHSALFNGSQFLSVPANAAFNIGTQDACIECFVYPIAYPAAYASLFGQNSGSTITMRIGLLPDARFWCDVNTDTEPDVGVFNGVELNKWYHTAVTFSGSQQQARFFVDGILIGSKSVASITQKNEAFLIGAEGTSEGNFNGAISNFRFVKGSIPIEYQTTSTTAGQKIFDVPTSTLQSIANTVLLTLTQPYFRDESTFKHSISGTASSTRRTPFANPENTQQGTISVSSSTIWNDTAGVVDFGTGAFTAETWIVLSSLTTGTNLFNVVLASNQVNGGFQIYKDDTTNSIVYGAINQTERVIIPAASVVANRWYHIAVVRSSTAANGTRVYVNGRLAATYTDTTNYTVGGIRIGGYKNSIYFPGSIGPTRIVKGTALYTSDFTPAPLTNVAGTSLLLNFDQMGISDKSWIAHTITNTWGTTVNTNTVKYGSRSLEFNGTNSRIVIAYDQTLHLGANDFTIECWVYQRSRPGAGIILEFGGGVNVAWPSYSVSVDPNGIIKFGGSFSNTGIDIGGITGNSSPK